MNKKKMGTMTSGISKVKQMLLLVCVLFTLHYSVKAQSGLDSTNFQLRNLFGNLAKPIPPKLFNWDMAAHFLDSSLFIPSNLADTLNADVWVRLYEEMYNSAYNQSLFKEVDSVYYPCLQFEPDTVNLLVVKYDYYRFKPNALNTNIYFDFDTIANTITDKPIRPGFPYNDFSMFAVSPCVTETPNAFVTYRLGTENTLFDSFNALDGSGGAGGMHLDLNFHDGQGWQNVTLGQDNYFGVQYTNVANQLISARVRVGNDPDPKAISLSTIHNLNATNFIAPDEEFDFHNLNVGIYNPCSGVPLDKIKTVIYLEGIDIMDFLPKGYRNLDEIYNQISGSGLGDLRNFGYRFVVVNWKNSRIDMNDNADNVISLINRLKCENVNNNNEEQFVIIGESMGGVIARLAMLKMELEKTSDCFPEKEHNTRLLITLDAPHGGAHVPMGMQKMANFLRNGLGGALGSVSIGNPILGIPFGVIGTKLFFKSQDLFLDGDAAKQMLMDHVSTSSIIGPINYHMHEMREDLLEKLDHMGNYPRHTKLMAISNGNMMGHGQTKMWDGTPRVAGDRILDASVRLHATILGQKFNYAGLDMRINSDPNGNGNLGGVNYGTWWIKIKLKWFGLKFYTGFNLLCNKDWDADMKPISTAAGGLLDYHGEAISAITGQGLHYVNQGNFESNNTSKFGMHSSVGSDGFHWNFVPSSSALDFGNGLNNKFDLASTIIITGHSPFDVSMGWKGDYVYAQSGYFLPDFDNNVYVRNHHHLDFRNDTLYNITATSKIPFIYDDNNCNGPNNYPNRPNRVINREIGDDKIYIENRVQPWKGAYSTTESILVNQNNPAYSYPTTINTLLTLPSVWSKDNPFVIGYQGYGIFNINIGTLNYNQPYTGPFGQFISGVGMCCEQYSLRSQQPTVLVKPIEKIKISVYPNPATNYFNFTISNYKAGELKLRLVNMQGNIVLSKQFNLTDTKYTVTIPVQLPNSLPSGIYMLQSETINNKTTTKIKIN